MNNFNVPREYIKIHFSNVVEAEIHMNQKLHLAQNVRNASESVMLYFNRVNLRHLSNI